MNASLRPFIYQEELYDGPAKVTVVLSEPWTKVTEAQRTLLSKILQSIGLSIDGVVVQCQPTLDVSQLGTGTSTILAFTTPAPGIPTYEAVRTKDTLLVVADRLEVLSGDDQAKRKLWAVLKTLAGS